MFTVLLVLIVITGFSVLAFWSGYAPIFLLLAGVSLMGGLKVYDILTNDAGLSVSLMLIGYAFVSILFALKYMFWQGEKE